MAAAREPLHEARPYDRLVLRSGSGEAVLDVAPIDLPGRRMPVPRPSGKLVFRTVDNPVEDIEAPWSSILRIEFFEQRLLQEAVRLTRAKQFGEAFKLLARIEKDYSSATGLEQAIETLLKNEARERYLRGDRESALMLLQSLHERLPRAKGVAQAVDSIANQTIEEHWRGKDYDGIRRTLSTIRNQFGDLSLRIEDVWRERLAESAQSLRDEAVRMSDAGDFREALRRVTQAEGLEPDSPRNRQLRDEIRRANPILWVGVFEQADPATPPALDTPAARRVGWLFHHDLVRLEDYGPTGGVYGSPLGEVGTDETRQSIRIDLGDDARTTHRLARALLTRAGGPLAPLALEQARALSVDPAGRLVVDLRQQHPSPASLLKGMLPEELRDAVDSPWELTGHRPEAYRYSRRDGGPPGGFSIIDELLQDDADQAVEALLNGELDLLANVPPWWLGRLENESRIGLGRRRVPTLHCLLFGPDTPLRATRETRRAIVYAIARETTLREILLAGESPQGFELISAPLPQGLTLGDPLRYAYNDGVRARPYEPRLAALLIQAERRSRASLADRQEEDPTPPGPVVGSPERPIVLAHPPTPVARLACDAIQKQLAKVGMTVRLIEAPESRLARGAVEHDLRYTELVVEEPMVDVWRVLGPEGMAGECSDPMRLALDQLRRATTGQRAAKALRQIHEVCHNETPLVPLWQTVDHFAYRKDLRGMPDTTAGLYQTIDNWRMAGREP